MKIIIAQKIAVLSGTEWHILNLIPKLIEKGHEVHFLAFMDVKSLEKANELVQMFLDRKIVVHQLNVESDFSFKLYKKNADIIKSEGYDIIHSHLIRTDFIMSVVKALFLKKMFLISSAHGFENDYQIKHGFNYISDPLNKFILISKFSHIFINHNIAMSNGIKNLFVSHGILKNEKMDVIHHGFIFENVTYYPNPGLYRKSKYQILIVGRLVGFKGHEFVFRIMPDLINRYGNDISLVILGHGILEHELKSRVEEMGIAGHVHFIGFSTKVHDYIKNSDVVAIPSKSEGFCVVIMEAFYSGCPIVAFDVPAINESVHHLETGLLAPPYDVNVLRDNIITLMENKDLATKIRSQAKQYLNSYLTVDRMVNETNELYL
jgi:glycosyltransferase involved in cell wall biosynthesis